MSGLRDSCHQPEENVSQSLRKIIWSYFISCYKKRRSLGPLSGKHSNCSDFDNQFSKKGVCTKQFGIQVDTNWEVSGKQARQ